MRQQEEAVAESYFDKVIAKAAHSESTRGFLEKNSLLVRIMQNHNDFLSKEKQLQKLFAIDSIDVMGLEKVLEKKKGETRAAPQLHLQQDLMESGHFETIDEQIPE
jgi:hypothetical protein